MNERLKAKKEKLESNFNKLREDNDQYYSRWYKSTTSTDEVDYSEAPVLNNFETQRVLDS